MAKNTKGGSLRDQLRQAGLVTAKQLKKAEKGSHRKEMRVRAGLEADDVKVEVERARSEKAERDRQANQERDKVAAERALTAQVAQMVASNAQREAGDVAYNFSDGVKVKTISVSGQNQQQLNRGFLAIVRRDNGYELVPEKVARKIMARDPGWVVYLYERGSGSVAEDDPYKDYPIPDDLDW